MIMALMSTFLLTLSLAHIDPQALEQLHAAAQEAESSALLVMHQGTIVKEWYAHGPPRPLSIQSITKSITALVLGRIVGTDALPTIDAPVWHIYPEWRQGNKQRVTVRHLLTHSSCLQDDPTSVDEITRSPDSVKLALAAELLCMPGETYRYNNKAVNLLGGITERTTGQKLNKYADRVLFQPLGIRDVRWGSDSAGNPSVAGGLLLRARDLAKIGKLLVEGGKWQGATLVPEAWLHALSTTSRQDAPNVSLLWNVLRDGAHKEAQQDEWPATLFAYGWGGQWMLVVPTEGLVVVRQYDVTRQRGRQTDFPNFLAHAMALIGQHGDYPTPG